MKINQQEPIWEPYGSGAHGQLSVARKNALPDSAFAFPRARKEPMTDATHVKEAIVRFNQVTDVTDLERDIAFANIRKAAKHFGIKMKATKRRQLAV